jgi:hypothetical protein
MESTASKYDILRKRAQQTAAQGQQRESGALQRRFSSLGMGGSGAAIKAEMLSQEKSRDQALASEENIGFQEAAEKERLAESDTNRKFMTSERLGSQEFARGERLGSEKFGAGESALARKFAAEQAAQAMKFQTSERLGTQDFTSKENKAARAQAQLQFDRQMNAQARQFKQSLGFEEKKFLEEMRVNDFNMKMAAKMAGQRGLLDKLFSASTYKDAAIDGLTGFYDGGASWFGQGISGGGGLFG